MNSELSKLLHQHAVKRSGGMAAVLQEFVNETVGDYAKKGVSLKDLLDEAERQGWLEELLKVKLKDLSGIINPNQTTSTTDIQKAKASRLSQEEKYTLQNKIREFLEGNPWSSCADISEFFGEKTRKTSYLLKSMMKQDLLQSRGQKAQTKYAIKPETESRAAEGGKQ